MEELFYTPETQEEVLDFLIHEKYIWTDNISPISGNYIPITFTKNLVTSLDAFCNMCNKAVVDGIQEFDFLPSNFRIKYLCKEDIEELGWKPSPDEPDERFDSYKGNYGYQLYFDDKIENKDLGVGITIYDDDSNRVFNGYIKNKSELKKLLKQLNIE